MLPDPYRPGSTPRYLAGRDAQLTTIRHYLAPILAYGEMAGPQLVVHGPRGVGKTSLLDVAVRRAQANGFIVAWTSCVRNQPFLADLRDAVTRALSRADILPETDRWRVTLEKVGVELSLPALAKISAEVRPKRQQQAPPAPGAVTALEDLLHLAGHAARHAKGHDAGAGLIVVIDELHAGSQAELGILLNAVQNLDREREHNPLAILGAGVPSVRGALTRAATFGERTSWVSVGDLSAAQAREALTQPAEDLHVHWDPGAVDIAVKHSQHYPHFVQIMGRASWRAAEPDAGGAISRDDTVNGVRVGGEEILDMYAARWDASTDVEKRVMRVMAEVGGDGDVARRDIESALKSDISVARDQLLNKAVVSDVGRGRLRFTLPGFADFVRRYSGQGSSRDG